MTGAAIYFQPLDIDLGTLRHPIRHVHGGNDRSIPISMVREFTGKIAGAERVVEESLGHISLILRRAAAALDYFAAGAAEAGD